MSQRLKSRFGEEGDSKLLWVGLTGGIATGKTTASKILREMGCPVIDADEVARRVVEPGRPGSKALRGYLGSTYFDSDGNLQRKELAQLIFSDLKARLQVEQILHPFIQKEVEHEKETLEKKGERLVFYDVPLLFEKGLSERFDSTVLIYADEKTQRTRLASRENWSPIEIDSRLKSQWPIEKKKSLADHVVNNQSSVKDLRRKLEQLVEHFRSLKS